MSASGTYFNWNRVLVLALLCNSRTRLTIVRRPHPFRILNRVLRYSSFVRRLKITTKSAEYCLPLQVLMAHNTKFFPSLFRISFAPFDPRSSSDPRLSFFMRTLGPSIRDIEFAIPRRSSAQESEDYALYFKAAMQRIADVCIDRKPSVLRIINSDLTPNAAKHSLVLECHSDFIMRLERLEVSSVTYTPDLIQMLSAVPDLTRLSISGPSIVEGPQSPISRGFRKLTDLFLHETAGTIEQFLSYVANSSALRDLFLIVISTRHEGSRNGPVFPKSFAPKQLKRCTIYIETLVPCKGILIRN